MNVTVCVLMSTYNGEDYLKEQIESILQQEGVDVRLVVRDDGSSDRTLAILENFKHEGKLEILPDRKNVGAGRSFLELLKKTPVDARYFAFSDQDDVWLQDKLAKAVLKLEKSSANQPAMVFARQEVVDQDLNTIGLSNIPKRIGLGNALVECITPGCTIVINEQARNLLINNYPARLHMMHDWWIYLTLACFGSIVYEQTLSMKYRQHAKNVIGRKVSFLNKFLVRWRRFRSSGKFIGYIALPSEQAIEFKKTFGARIPADKAALIDGFIAGKTSFLARLRMSCSGRIRRQSLLDDFLTRLLIIFNKY